MFDNVKKIIMSERKLKSKHKKIKIENLFKNLMYCGLCGQKGVLSTGRGTYSAYRCSNHAYYGNIVCENKSCVNYVKVKDAVYYLLKNIFRIYCNSSAENFDDFEDDILPENNNRDKVIDASEIKNKKLQLFEKYTDNIISEEDYLSEIE